MEGRQLRRRSVTLSEQLSVGDSSNLRDLLNVRDEDETRLFRRRPCEGREGSVASGGGRTLLDIIQREHEGNGIIAGGISSNGGTWRSLRDRLRRAGAAREAASSSQSHPTLDPKLVASTRPNPDLARSVSRSVSVQNSEPGVPEPTAMSTAAERPSVNGGGSDEISGRENSEEPPERVSLMALLEQTDRQWDGSRSEESALAVAEAEEDEVAAEEAKGRGGGMWYVCCVCMVRHKGAAFIPCGHTFCRLCSRELWLSRGSCPLCNGFILEILDIF
ncbi:RING [Musa troglodytarum]|uniref:RING n=1 Tax=Musa troglodytarum TaxID=320322 RepID=A0A9E7JNF0_9LILI|nr:RING [Musa troglodytarum]